MWCIYVVVCVCVNFVSQKGLGGNTVFSEKAAFCFCNFAGMNTQQLYSQEFHFCFIENSHLAELVSLWSRSHEQVGSIPF